MKAISYKKELLKQLRADPKFAQEYLKQVANTGDQPATQLAVNDVLEAIPHETFKFVLAPKQWDKFQALLNAPAKDIPAFTRLMTQPSIFEKQQETAQNIRP